MLAVLTISLALVSKERVIQFLSVSTILVLMANNVLIARTYFTVNLDTTDRLRSRIESLREQSTISPLKIYFGELRNSTKLKLDRAGVQYEEVRDLSACLEKERMLIGNVACLCKG